jgi:thioesterase domain-containing protein
VNADPAVPLPVSVEGDLDEEAAEQADLVGLHLGGARPPLFLIRTWSGEVAQHRALARHLGPDQPIYSLPPPRGTRPEDFPKDAQDWAERALSRLLEIPHAGPYRLGGWSFGGVIALEVGERLRESGRAVELLVMLDTRLPKQWPVRRRGSRRRSALHKSVKQLDRFLELGSARERLDFLRGRAARRREKIARRWARLRGLASREPEALPAPEASSADATHLTMTGGRMSQLKRAIWVAYLKYRPSGSALRIVQLRTLESQTAAGDSSLGWGPYLTGDLETTLVPGEHFTMFEEAFVPVLARRLAEALERVSAAPAAGPRNA